MKNKNDSLKRLLSLALTGALMFSINTHAFERSAGDVDNNGNIDAKDCSVIVQKTINNSFTVDPEYNIFADVNADGYVDAKDAAIVFQYVLKQNVTLKTNKQEESSTEATTESKVNEVTYDLKGDDIKAVAGTLYSDSQTYGAYTILPQYKYGSREVTVNSETYNQFIQLNGVGDSTKNAVTFFAPTQGTFSVIARSSNATEVRNLVVADSSGKELGVFTMPVSGDEPQVCTVDIPSSGRYYIYSTIKNINIYRLTYRSTGNDFVTESTTEATTKESTEGTTHEPWTETSTEIPTFSGSTDDGTVVKNFEELKSAISNGDKKIYVSGTILCSERISLDKNDANVEFFGLTNSDGTAATLDFTPLRDSRTSSGSGGSGFFIPSGAGGYTFRNLIIEKAGDCGIRIQGNNNTFTNCIFRYNNNSGVSVTGGGSGNIFYYVDSYRNGDIVQKNGSDADGFSVKLQAGENNYFYNCRAWENSDDGWDSYDRGTPYVGAIYYIECVTWNNGNPYVFTGEYDYEHGYALDKDLLYVEEILRQDPDFESKYNAHTVSSWPHVTLNLLGTSNTYEKIHSASWLGNPNGFKFGSAETPNTSYRYIENCIAYGHENTPNQKPAKGFDQNNGYAKYDIKNALSFDNGQNYWMDRMSAVSMEGVFYGFSNYSQTQADAPGDLTITSPSTEKEEQIRKEVSEKSGYILESVYKDILPGKVLYNVF